MLAIITEHADAVEGRGGEVVVVLLLAIINGSTDTQRGNNRWSIQDNIWQHHSSDKPQLRARLRQLSRDSSAHSSPHAHSKSQILAKSWGGWRWQSGGRGVSVRRRGDTTLHLAHIPFGPSVCPRPSLYFEETPARHMPADSLAYNTEWAARVTT